MAKEVVAISVQNVSKSFKLPHEKNASIKGAFINLFHGSRMYERQQVLKNISFEIKKGEFFGIVGRNGSGKSTLLKLLAGIYSPNSGTINVNGKLTPFIELGVGFNPELTGRENVYLNGALLGFSRKDMESKYEDIVAFAEIEQFMDQKLKNYSSGMQVRLAFSIAIRAETDILLIDEVLAVGDAIFQQKCYDYFDKIKNSDKTVIFISHDMGAVQSFCDRAILIEKGDIVDEGSPNKVTQSYSEMIAAETKVQEYESVALQHTGAGGAEILGAELHDPQGRRVKSVKEGETFTVRIKYKLNKTLDQPVIGIGIMGMQGQSIIGPNTKYTEVFKSQLPNKGFVDATFSSNPLSSGTYRIRAGIFNTAVTTPYDFVENLIKLTVTGKKRYGDIYIEPKWHIYADKERKK